MLGVAFHASWRFEHVFQVLCSIKYSDTEIQLYVHLVCLQEDRGLHPDRIEM